MRPGLCVGICFANVMPVANDEDLKCTKLKSVIQLFMVHVHFFKSYYSTY